MRLTHSNQSLLVGLALAVALPSAGCLDAGGPGEAPEAALLADADGTIAQGLTAPAQPLWSYPGGDIVTMTHECVLGDVTLADRNAQPRNALPAWGSPVMINLYVGLYSVIGTKFGVYGPTNFNLPDLRAAAPEGTSYFVCTDGYYPSDRMAQDCIVGSVRLTAAQRDRSGMEPADGRVVSIAAYPALFAAIGDQYGGDGVTTFALPDAQADAPDGITAYVCSGRVASS